MPATFTFSTETGSPFCSATREILKAEELNFDEKEENGYTTFQWLYNEPQEIWMLGVKTANKMMANGGKPMNIMKGFL